MPMTRHNILSPLARQSARPQSSHQLEFMAEKFDNINIADLLIELKAAASALAALQRELCLWPCMDGINRGLRAFKRRNLMNFECMGTSSCSLSHKINKTSGEELKARAAGLKEHEKH